MNFTIFIMTAIMLLTLFVPFVVAYGIKGAKQKNYEKHKKIQNRTFIISMIGLFILEGLIRYSGGSGSLASKSSYYDTSYFKPILAAHISGAILTYLLWTIQIIFSNIKFTKKLPGAFSKTHRTMGKIIFLGLIYTAITALIVYVFTLDLI